MGGDERPGDLSRYVQTSGATDTTSSGGQSQVMPASSGWGSNPTGSCENPDQPDLMTYFGILALFLIPPWRSCSLGAVNVRRHSPPRRGRAIWKPYLYKEYLLMSPWR